MVENIQLWSQTAATNATADPGINFSEGQLPGSLNDSNRAVMATIAKWRDDTNGTLTTGGSANAQTVTTNTAYAALATGLRLRFKAGFTNTAAVTLNVTPSGGAAFGAKAVKVMTVNGEADPGPGQIRADGHYDVEYDTAANSAAGAWMLLNPSAGNLNKVLTGTRDLTAASGSVAYTGIGFKPTSLRIIYFADGGSPGIYGNGAADSALGMSTVAYTSDAGLLTSSTTNLILYTNGATTAQQKATITSFDADGFTLSWTKVGSPSGTLQLHFFAMR